MHLGRIMIPFDLIRSLVVNHPLPEWTETKLEFCRACNPELPGKVQELIGLPEEFKVHYSFYDAGAFSLCLIVEHPELPECLQGEELPQVRPICYQKYYPKTGLRRVFVGEVYFVADNREIKHIELISRAELEKAEE